MTRIARLTVTLGLAMSGAFACFAAGGCHLTKTEELAADRYTGERLPATIEEERAWGYPHEDDIPITPPPDATFP